MARDIETIAGIILDQITTGLAAEGITLSTSTVAEYTLWANTIASTINAKEVIEDAFKSDVDSDLTTKQPASIFWYVQQALAFQYGDTLSVSNTGVLYYAVIDVTKQIIQQASVREIDNSGFRELIVKIAKVDTDGNFIKATDDERLAFANYFEVIKWAGTYVVVVSLDPDIIFYDMDIKFDGIYAQSDVNDRILAALVAFQKQTRFDAIFYASSMLDAILKVPGVIAAKFNSLNGTPNGGSSSAITLDYELQSGYFNYDNASTLTLTTI